MWTMTTNSFVSAVAHRDNPALLMLRSRDRESLTRVAEDLGLEADAVYSSLPADYAFRLVLSRSRYAIWCHDQASKINYENYKVEASRQRDGAFTAFLHRVWTEGQLLTDRETRESNAAAWDEHDRHWRRL